MPDTFLPRRGNYRNLIAFQKAECIYDMTYHFTHRFFGKSDRTIDQMVQAARSGRQNIAEGSAASATSTETEIKLTNVARASLQELLCDYEDYLRVHGLTQWKPTDPRAIQTRKVCAAHNDSAFFMHRIEERSVEAIANIIITLIHQADTLLGRLIDRQQADFLANGGIRERMYQARLAARNKNKNNNDEDNNNNNQQ